MPPRRPSKRDIQSYEHQDKERSNNPPVGLVTSATDPHRQKQQTYSHDPHLDPQLHWAGKAEHTSFEVPTVSLHVHERIDPRTIVEAVSRRHGNNGSSGQMRLFDEERQIPLGQAIEFYRHSHNWSNRLIAGDSLLVMNSLLHKENMSGKVQCVYMDPPYGIKYGSNFQPFVNQRDVKDGKDEDLTAEPEMIKAFRDTWELGIHSYLSYMRDRLLLAKELLSESGSVFVQISDENVHHVREIMDEVFGVENFVSLITFKKTGGFSSLTLANVADYIVWYTKDKIKIKHRTLYVEKELANDPMYRSVMLKDGKTRKLTQAEILNPSLLPNNSKIFRKQSLQASGSSSTNQIFHFQGETYQPSANAHWKTSVEGLKKLAKEQRITRSGKTVEYLRFLDDFPVMQIRNIWNDTMGVAKLDFVVQTSLLVIQRCILMTTDPGDLVFDPTCGSGTTAFVAEQWGRRWITCDTSRVALTLARQRLMTATFDYYKLAYPDEGVGSGFEYKKVPHITLKSIANNEPPATETLFDQPFKDTKRARVTGPFTVEAVPSPTVQPLNNITDPEPTAADNTMARCGETLRQCEWRDELLNTGIRGKSGQRISFYRVDPLPCHWLHADAETKPDDSGKDTIKEPATAYKPHRAVVSFGPEHAPLEQRQVALAIEEAQTLVPKPEIVVFAAFQFDPEAAKDIDEINWPGVTLLKAQMNADLQTEDLKKKRASNESFWLVGQPDVEVESITQGEDAGKYRVQVNGFDYFNLKTGDIESGDDDKIAIWMLDTDYDGRSLYPSQVFFPMSGSTGGWAKLARNLKAEIDGERIESYRGTVSLPFEFGANQRIAVKIVDDRGIESLKIVTK